jgi:hypothetical protein
LDGAAGGDARPGQAWPPPSPARFVPEVRAPPSPRLAPSENGISEKGEAKRTGDDRFYDPLRLKYFQVRRRWRERGRAGAPDASAVAAPVSGHHQLRPKGRALLTPPLPLPPPAAPAQGYIDEVCKTVNAGVKLTHYFVWSFMDNWVGAGLGAARGAAQHSIGSGTPACVCPPRHRSASCQR